MAPENRQTSGIRPQTLSGISSPRQKFVLPDDSKLTQISRPQRWDVPFGEDVTEEDVERVLALSLFKDIDENRFPKNIPLRGLIANDTRFRSFKKGEIIVREGDYGNSAFFVYSGNAKVVLQGLPVEMLGRSKAKKKGILQSLFQYRGQSFFPETRDYKTKDVDRLKRLSEEGSSIYLQDIPGILDENNTVVLAPGELFGELGALGRTPRSSTVIADGDAVLLEIRWQGLRELRNYAPEWKKNIDTLYRTRGLDTHLKHLPLLAGLSDENLENIANETRFETYGNFDWYGEYKAHAEQTSQERLKIEPVIALENDYPNGLILIRNGFARVSRKYNHGERTDRYLGKGEVFGFAELGRYWLHKEHTPLRRSLRAIGYVDVLIIPTSTVEKYIFPNLNPEELEKLIRQEEATIAEHEETVESAMEEQTLEFLVENRYINGTATMLIDLERCTRCDDCVRACASTHDNNPRFIRNGPQVKNVMIANACMHCVDPVCMIGCPTGAIHRESAQGQVSINDNTCIGCSTCANSCPYHNIHMVPVRDKAGNFILDDDTHVPIQKATKCDLCVEQLGGPACARACPHDAMIRADMSDISVLSKFFNR